MRERSLSIFSVFSSLGLSEVAERAELKQGEAVAAEHFADLAHGVEVIVAAEALHILQRLLEHLGHL
jgi:hypothetical protein